MIASWMGIIWIEIKDWLIFLIMGMPRTRLTTEVKVRFLRGRGAAIGREIVLYEDVWIARPDRLRVGDNVDLAKGVLITAGGGVTIGSRVMIGYQTCVLSANHRIPPGRLPIYEAGHDFAPVRIEDDVWIAANCVILPGVTIGEGSVVAAGSVVTADVEPFTIVGGAPARLIRQRASGAG